jgi:hypothetical protein
MNSLPIVFARPAQAHARDVSAPVPPAVLVDAVAGTTNHVHSALMQDPLATMRDFPHKTMMQYGMLVRARTNASQQCIHDISSAMLSVVECEDESTLISVSHTHTHTRTHAHTHTLAHSRSHCTHARLACVCV